MSTMTVTILERADHWMVVWPDRAEIIRTASEALLAVRERGRLMAEADNSGGSTLIIEWAPTTAIGRRIVMALQ